MQELLGLLVQAYTLLDEAKDHLMHQEKSFFLVMIGTYIGVAKSVVSVSIDLLKKEKES